MTIQTVSSLERTTHKTHEWLKELQQIGRFEEPAQAYSVFRAVLHALRDRLTTDEAVDLSAQLPMLVRGFYFEGWKPSSVPLKDRDRQAFLDHVNAAMRQGTPVDPEWACRATFQLLAEKITAGEIEDVKQMVPEDVRALWP